MLDIEQVRVVWRGISDGTWMEYLITEAVSSPSLHSSTRLSTGRELLRIWTSFCFQARLILESLRKIVQKATVVSLARDCNLSNSAPSRSVIVSVNVTLSRLRQS